MFRLPPSGDDAPRLRGARLRSSRAIGPLRRAAGLGCAAILALLVALAHAPSAPALAHARSHTAHTATGWTRVQSHIETWAFDDGCNGGVRAGPALVDRWVTFAESDCGRFVDKAQTDCHHAGHVRCLVMQYLDPDWNYLAEHVGVPQARPGWWLHEPPPDQSRRISSTYFGAGHLLNQTNPAVRAFFRSYARRYYNADDGLLLDWQSPSLSQELYYSNCGCRVTSEIRTDAALQAAHNEMSAMLTHRDGRPFTQVDNTLPPNPYLPQGLGMLNHSTGVDGWVVEGQPVDYDVFDPYYSTLLDQIAYVATRTSGYVVPMSRARAGASYQRQSRRVAEATMLLGYSPGHLVDWSNLETGSLDLAIWPEEGIYPTRPVQSMGPPGGAGCLAGTGVVCATGGHNDLQVAPGVYRREFRDCYDRGVPFGPCAAIVNANPTKVTVRPTWLSRSYGHEIAMVGGDLQSRGTLNFKSTPFRAGVTSIAGHDAALLAR
jgi:hypothetical protein